MNITEFNYKNLNSFRVLIHTALFNPPLVAPTVVEEKYEKHKQNSEPILSNVLTPYEAFKEGFEKAIASYIKLGQEDLVKNKVVSQPQHKSEETQILEDLIKSLLVDFNSVKFVKQNDRYFAVAHGKLYQFSALLERVNFNQIELTDQELTAYHQLLDSGYLYQTPLLDRGRPTEQDFEELDSEHLCRSLSFAEKEAINIYTGNFYVAMNSLMHGKIDRAIEANYFIPDVFTPKAKINHAIKETLLHIAVAVSGLNKLPDYVPPLGADGQPQKYLYRGEGQVSEETLKKRKWAILNGKGITMEMGFLSTSFQKPASGFFGEYSQSGLMIKNLKGKKITPLSQYGNGEREILLPPTQIQWLYSKDIISDVYKNQITLFIAKPVNVAPELVIDYVPYTEEWLVKTIDPNENILFGIDTAIV